MRPLHIRLERVQQDAILTAQRMPQLEFRQALFRTADAAWQRRLYPAGLVVTTTAFAPDGRTLLVDHQVMRFSLLYNATWPEPVFLRIRNWHYRPVQLRKDVLVGHWSVELRLRDLRLGEDEAVELVLLG